MIIEVIIGVIIVVMWTKFLNVNEAVKLKHILLLLSKNIMFLLSILLLKWINLQKNWFCLYAVIVIL